MISQYIQDRRWRLSCDSPRFSRNQSMALTKTGPGTTGPGTLAPDAHSGFSRRDFLRGSGAAAAAAGIAQQTQNALAQEKGKQVVSGQQTIKLNVNGKD